MILNSRQMVAGAHLGSHNSHIRIEVTKRVKTKLRRDDSDFNWNHSRPIFSGKHVSKFQRNQSSTFHPGVFTRNTSRGVCGNRDQSETRIQITWSLSANQRPVSWSRNQKLFPGRLWEQRLGGRELATPTPRSPSLSTRRHGGFRVRSVEHENDNTKLSLALNTENLFENPQLA